VSLTLGQATGSDDEAAIKVIVNHWQEAWEIFDASVLQGDYAVDADWMNSFARKNKGAARIMSFMVEGLQHPGVRGRHTVWKEPQIRFIRSDVAIAYRDYQTVGQKNRAGQELPQRNTHSTWVLSKENGRWLIVSQFMSDDNLPIGELPKDSAQPDRLGSSCLSETPFVARYSMLQQFIPGGHHIYA
jgi:uncharacterized protein (TIGR02246 family)